MLESLKNFNLGNGKDSTVAPSSKPGTPANAPIKSNLTGTFGGLNANQMKKQIELASSGEKESSLRPSEVSDSAKKSLESSRSSSGIKITNTATLAEELATTFSEGEIKSVIDTLRSHINANRGAVDKRFWFMLMDAYQVSQNKADFDKAALSFAHLFGASPPSWKDEEVENTKSVLAGKNILIFDAVLKTDYIDKFKLLLKAAREEKFCRINVSQCKFEQSELVAINSFYKLMTDLRKYKIMSVLMGDNNLIAFCKNYINPNIDNKQLNTSFIENEQLFWLIYLEILQWKGKQEEFEELALDFAMKFELSPPGWENQGIMTFNNNNQEEDTFSLEKNYSINNISALTQIIDENLTKGNKAEIDLLHVDRIDFSAAGTISHHIQEIISHSENSNKKIIFKNPNELILVLFEMVGVSEFIDIIPRKR